MSLIDNKSESNKQTLGKDSEKMQIDINAICRDFGNVTAFCNEHKIHRSTFARLQDRKSHYFKPDSKSFALFKKLERLGYLTEVNQ